jgi:hypothetical protein
MARRESDELMEMLRELAALQRENAERLSLVERCLALVTAALPSLAAGLRGGKAEVAGEHADPRELLSSEDQQVLFDEAAEALDHDYEENARPRRFLNS